MSDNSTNGQRNYTRADLEAFNDERAKTLIPVMTILVLLMFVGIVGNALVCYIFSCRLKSGTQNFLFVCLAVLDLLSCIISMPYQIAEIRFYYIFESAVSCKIMRFINAFCPISSDFTLIVIAVDRYRRICKPLHGQLRMFHARLSLIPIFGGALVLGWTVYFKFGLQTTETEIPGLFGHVCSTQSISENVYPFLLTCILFLCFIILTVSIVVIYTLVLRETKRHSSFMNRNSNFNIPSSRIYNLAGPAPAYPPARASRQKVQLPTGPYSLGTVTTGSPETYPQLIKVSTLLGSNGNEPDINYSQSEPTTDGALASITPSNNTMFCFTNSALPSTSEDIQLPPDASPIIKGSSLVSNNGGPRKDSRVVLFSASENSIKIRRRLKSKATIIAFTVSLLFIISFFPHLCLQVIKYLVKGFDYNLQGSALVAYNLFLRSYYIHSVSNPFIYAALNVHFRQEVKDLLKKCVTKP